MENADRKFALVVEDNSEFAQLTTLMLSRMGLETFHAQDGNAALAALSARRPDLVLLDLNLPGMNGWQVLEQMVARYGQGTIPVIITSAYSDGANRVIGKLQDVSHYLIKPFTVTDLMTAVERALAI